MKKIATVLILVIVLGLVAGCFTTVHKVGNGSQTGTVVEARQWYAIWGLVPIGDKVDSQAMANGAADYEVKTLFQSIARQLKLNNNRTFYLLI
jgi:hypothetical protein